MPAKRPLGMAMLGLVVSGGTAAAQTVTRVSVANDGSQVASGGMEGDLSDDGTRVVFTSTSKIVPQDTNSFSDVYLRDVSAGTTTLVSVTAAGKSGNNRSFAPRISDDGRFVAFVSQSTNLVAGDANGRLDVFVRDLGAGVTVRASVASDGTEGDGDSQSPAISGDGGTIVFTSLATNLVPGDSNGVDDVFVHDRASAFTATVSVAADGSEANGVSAEPDVSRDGRVVAFGSFASNLVTGDTNGWYDVFVRDLVAAMTVRANVTSDGAQVSDGGLPRLSGDGKVVAFQSLSGDLVPNDWNDAYDTFVHDMSTGTTSIVSVDSEGQVCGVPEWGGNLPGSVSEDGRFVVFHSNAVGLADGKEWTPGFDFYDVYVRDVQLGMTTRQSRNTAGMAAAGNSFWGRISADGRFVAFISSAGDLGPADTNGAFDVFLLERPLRDPFSASYGTGWAGRQGVPVLSIDAAPFLNQPVELSVDNSAGTWTVGLLMLGTQSIEIPTSAGGELLVLPDFAVLIAIPPSGLRISEKFPPDELLASISIFLQVLELDPFATEGVSFTNGLELGGGF